MYLFIIIFKYIKISQNAGLEEGSEYITRVDQIFTKIFKFYLFIYVSELYT